MIQVGIDISRLNLMLMIGQPKLTSEYIQASSRVGRTDPGIVFVMYDGTKSRDRSFYEQFKSYHNSFYRFVEPTGATPFSEPACDRALHAVLITLLRYQNEELKNDSSACGFDKELYREQINEIKAFLCNRNKEISERINSKIKVNNEYIENLCEKITDDWAAKAKESSLLRYGKMGAFSIKEDESRLLKPFGTSPNETDTFDTMTSMRSVDASIPGQVIIWGENNEQ